MCFIKLKFSQTVLLWKKKLDWFELRITHWSFFNGFKKCVCMLVCASVYFVDKLNSFKLLVYLV